MADSMHIGYTTDMHSRMGIYMEKYYQIVAYHHKCFSYTWKHCHAITANPLILICWIYFTFYIDDLQKRRNSSALPMELRLSCINPSISCMIILTAMTHHKRLPQVGSPHFISNHNLLTNII